MATTQPSEPYPFYEGESIAERGIRVKLRAFLVLGETPSLAHGGVCLLGQPDLAHREILLLGGEAEQMAYFLNRWSSAPWRIEILCRMASHIIPQIDPEYSQIWGQELSQQIDMALAQAERDNHRRGIRFFIDFDIHEPLVQQRREVVLWASSVNVYLAYYGHMEQQQQQEVDYSRRQQLPNINSLGAIPASRAAIENLKRVRCDDNDVRVRVRVIGGQEQECSICFEEFEKKAEEDDLACMPCFHTFHYLCLAQWLELSRACPLCRHPLIE